MQFVKLQIGCLLIILYIEVTYIKATKSGKLPCNKMFDALMVVAPWAVFFDGFTAWTVNHMEIVPELLNRMAHLLFFIFMDLMIIITAIYMYDQLVGFCKSNKKLNLILGIPGAISLLLIIGELDSLITFMEGQLIIPWDFRHMYVLHHCFFTME